VVNPVSQVHDLLIHFGFLVYFLCKCSDSIQHTTVSNPTI